VPSLPKELTMTDQEQLDNGAAATEPKGISRRKMIVTGATLAVAGAAVGAAVPLTMSASDGGEGAPNPTEPVMVHLKDLPSGQLDVFVGTRHASFTDHAMAAQLARQAASAT
jgi:hypothetical protein